jgi:hypothetical protein
MLEKIVVQGERVRRWIREPFLHLAPLELFEQSGDWPIDCLPLFHAKANVEVVVGNLRFGVRGKGQSYSRRVQARKRSRKTQQKALCAQLGGLLVQPAELGGDDPELSPLVYMLGHWLAIKPHLGQARSVRLDLLRLQ